MHHNVWFNIFFRIVLVITEISLKNWQNSLEGGWIYFVLQILIQSIALTKGQVSGSVVEDSYAHHKEQEAETVTGI